MQLTLRKQAELFSLTYNKILCNTLSFHFHVFHVLLKCFLALMNENGQEKVKHRCKKHSVKD